MAFVILQNDLVATTSGTTTSRISLAQPSEDNRIQSTWLFDQVEGGMTIRNMANQFFVFALGRDVVVSPIRLVPTVWSVQQAGGGLFVIKLAFEDLLWTVVDNRIVLRPADGSPEQRFSVQNVL